MADLSSNPARLNLTIYHGRTDEIVLTWPAGALDGRGPWQATVTGPDEGDVDPIDLPVDVVGDVMTLDVPALDKALKDVTLSWELADAGRPIIGGRFTVSILPGPSTIEATVTIDEQTVMVELVGDPALSAQLDTHEADQTAHGTVESGSTAIVHPIPSSPVITPSPFSVRPIPGLVVSVPDLPDPVWLYGKAILDPLPPLPDSLAEVEANGDGMQLSLAVASETTILLDQVLDSSHAPLMWNGSGVFCVAELPAHSPGDYQLFATRTGGDLRVLTPSHARARIGWFRTRPPFT